MTVSPPHLFWRPTTPAFILAAAVANAVLYHLPLYSYALAHLDAGSLAGLLTLATVFVLATSVTALAFGVLSLVSERLVRPLLMGAALGSSVAVYFVHTYGAVLDKSMMGNVFDTNLQEAGGLFHPLLLGYVLVLGVGPCVLLSRVAPRRTPFLRRLAFVGLVFVATLAWAYANARSWLWIDQNSKMLGGMTMPWSYAINGPRRLAELATPRERRLLPPATFAPAGEGKVVVVLVIGEAARAQNFSLYGYPRPTNPVLGSAGVTVLPHAQSCSTYTTASLACMLAHTDSVTPFSWEPLTSYLARSGVDVIWRTGNWGEPPMKVQTFERAQELRKACQGAHCEYDEVLLHGLDARIRGSQQDRVFVVLHTVGSHGPAYDTKIPPQFETFKPVCRSVELQHCPGEELINAYDNTIVYADHFVGQAIELLRRFPGTPTALIYMSDHGESLGEYGLYLHGTPYTIAPAVQKDIPFIVWTSEAFRRRKPVAPAHLAPDATHSQANVFHSVMGAYDMRSEVYRPDLDIFSAAPLSGR